MRKILFLSVLFVLILFVMFSGIFAQPQKSGSGGEDVIIQKLDQIIQTQAEMMEYLKFIKNRSR